MEVKKNKPKVDNRVKHTRTNVSKSKIGELGLELIVKPKIKKSMIIIENEKMSYDIKLPTDLSELTKEYFDEMLKSINVADNYSVVALCYKAKLFEIINVSKKEITIQALSLLVKIGGNIDNVAYCKPMDKVIINRSSLERSQHLYIPHNTLEPGKVSDYICSNKDLVKDITTGKYFIDEGESLAAASHKAPYCYFVEYKIVPNNVIIAGISQSFKKEQVINPFIINRNNTLLN